MACRPSQSGCHLSKEQARSEAATICAAAPARRPTNATSKSTPETRFTVSITSSTGGGEMDNGVDPVLRDQRSHARLVTDVADHERRALRYRPIETGREVVEHHDALAGVDERMNHMASDIAGAAGDQDRHARGPLISPGVAGLGLGNFHWRRECTCSRPVTNRDVPSSVSLALRLIHRFST